MTTDPILHRRMKTEKTSRSSALFLTQPLAGIDANAKANTGVSMLIVTIIITVTATATVTITLTLAVPELCVRHRLRSPRGIPDPHPNTAPPLIQTLDKYARHGGTTESRGTPLAPNPISKPKPNPRPGPAECRAR